MTHEARFIGHAEGAPEDSKFELRGKIASIVEFIAVEHGHDSPKFLSELKDALSSWNAVDLAYVALNAELVPLSKAVAELVQNLAAARKEEEKEAAEKRMRQEILQKAKKEPANPLNQFKGTLQEGLFYGSVGRKQGSGRYPKSCKLIPSGIMMV